MSRVVKYGFVSGLLMAVFLSILSISGSFGESPLKFLKYLLVLIALWLFFSRIDSESIGRRFIMFFTRKAAVISLLTALVTVIINMFLYLIQPEFSFSKFNLSPAAGQDFIIINSTIFCEIFVLGLISAFILFPVFKPRDDLHKSDKVNLENQQ